MPRERDRLSVGRPGRTAVPAGVAGQPLLSASVGVHDVDVARAVLPGRERDLLAIGRPAHARKGGRQPSLPAAVGVHDIDHADVAGVERLTDESHLRTCRTGGKAWPSCGHSGSTLRLCRAVEDREDDDPDERNGGCACSVREASASRAPLRLLDKRLDEGLELFAVDRIARDEAGEVGR